MRKIFLGILSVMFCISIATVNCSFADGDVFETGSYSYVTPKNESAVTSTVPQATDATANTKEMANFKSAVFELDNAQIEIRERLVDYKAQYNDIDQQYQNYKLARKNMKNLIRKSERDIKKIERTKEKIKKF